LLCICFLDELFGFSDLAMGKGVFARAACALQYFAVSALALEGARKAFLAPSAHQMGVWRKQGAVAREISLNDKPKPSYFDI
jgi:hypothetical protein